MGVTARRIAAGIGGVLVGLTTGAWVPESATYRTERGLVAGIGLGMMVAALVRD